MRRMGNNPPDWKWCQNSNEADRKHYRKLLSEAPKSKNEQVLETVLFAQSNNERLINYLTVCSSTDGCSMAHETQESRNEGVLKKIDSLYATNVDLNKIEIFCLGHSDHQFNSIQDRSYIRKTNLNQINAGKYSGNEWAEARGFISREILSSHSEYIGFVTASWNLKYKPFTKIDYFHKWLASRVLLNSRPEDKIIVCADIFCPCKWFTGDSGGTPILELFFAGNTDVFAEKFKEVFEIELRHVKVPYSNQIICHRDVFQPYANYLVEFDVFEKVRWLVEDYGKDLIVLKDDDSQNKHLHARLYAYLIEAVTCFWFMKNDDHVFIPTAERVESWYSMDNVKKRTGWILNV